MVKFITTLPILNRYFILPIFILTVEIYLTSFIISNAHKKLL